MPVFAPVLARTHIITDRWLQEKIGEYGLVFGLWPFFSLSRDRSRRRSGAVATPNIVRDRVDAFKEDTVVRVILGLAGGKGTLVIVIARGNHSAPPSRTTTQSPSSKIDSPRSTTSWRHLQVAPRRVLARGNLALPSTLWSRFSWFYQLTSVLVRLRRRRRQWGMLRFQSDPAPRDEQT